MLRSVLLVIGHALTVDVIGLVQKMVGGIQKYRLLYQALPSLFPSLVLFSLPLPLPLLRVPLRLLVPLSITYWQTFNQKIRFCRLCSIEFYQKLVRG